jgi:ferredoxin
MATSYTVEIHHQGTTQTITVPDDQTILAAAQAVGLDLPTSCGAGVCTTCAALVLEGEVEQGDGMGVSTDSRKRAMRCSAWPTPARISSSRLRKKILSIKSSLAKGNLDRWALPLTSLP